MNGKVVLITGGTDGIGKEAAKQLAMMGAQIVIVGRNKDKSEAVVEGISSVSGNKQVFYLLADN